MISRFWNNINVRWIYVRFSSLKTKPVTITWRYMKLTKNTLSPFSIDLPEACTAKTPFSSCSKRPTFQPPFQWQDLNGRYDRGPPGRIGAHSLWLWCGQWRWRREKGRVSLYHFPENCESPPTAAVDVDVDVDRCGWRRSKLHMMFLDQMYSRWDRTSMYGRAVWFK